MLYLRIPNNRHSPFLSRHKQNAEIENFIWDEWFPSRLSFGKFKGRHYQDAREDAELRSWLEWLAESTNERSSAMGRWYLACCLSGKLERAEHGGRPDFPSGPRKCG